MQCCRRETCEICAEPLRCKKNQSFTQLEELHRCSCAGALQKPLCSNFLVSYMPLAFERGFFSSLPLTSAYKCCNNHSTTCSNDAAHQFSATPARGTPFTR